MKPIKTYEMKKWGDPLRHNGFWSTHKDMFHNDHREICEERLRNYYDIPENAKIIYVKTFSKETKNSFPVKLSEHYHMIEIIGEKIYFETIDIDVIYDLKKLGGSVHVEIQYE